MDTALRALSTFEMNEPVYDGRSDLLHQIGAFGGIYFRKHGPFDAGYVHNGHRHNQDHITSVMTGSVRVRYRTEPSEGPFKSAVFIGPINFQVSAGLFHEIEALENGTAWQCLFRVEPDDVIQFA